MRESNCSKRRKEKEKKSDKEDRLSALPDEAIYHIFSFLDMRQVVKTCLLSNKWRYLWRSTPTLSFDNNDIDCDCPGCGCRRTLCECEPCLSKRAEFRSFVYNIITLGSSNLVKLQISDYYHVEPARVYEWINAALARRVQDVDISAYITGPLVLPLHLFSSNLRALKLRCRATVPNSICAATWIKHLELTQVVLPDGNTNGELVLKFSVLESLRLNDCDVSHLKIICIYTPVLENLDFTRLHIGKSSSCVVKTCSPNLKFLSVYEYRTRNVLGASVNYYMENLSSLVSADISVRYRGGSDNELVEECRKFWVKAVCWMCNVQALKLQVSSVQLLLDSPKLLERLPGIFCSLKHVMLNMYGLKNFHSKEVLKFLERAPHIETLVLLGHNPSWWTPRESEEEWTKEKEWAAEDWIPSPLLFNHMVSFEFRNFNGLNVEMKFVEFVLEKAIALKKMIIKTKKEWLQGKPYEEILSFPRASSSVSILFQVTELSATELDDKRYFNAM
ncbi:hypothetical protein ACHQM5_011362 [Ranunculus cassubicifolius]